MYSGQSASSYGRRKFLLAAGAGAAALAGAGNGSGQPSDSAVSFESAASDGTSVTVSVTTSVDVYVSAYDAAGTGFIREPVPAGTDETLTLRPSEPIPETQEITVRLLTRESDPAFIAGDSGTVTITETPPETGISFVEADPEAGFNYPYYVYVPIPVPRDDPIPVLVEPNNTGTATNDFQEHKDRARERAEGGTSRTISDELGVPLVVPVFPRPSGDPVEYTHYTHALDRETLQLSGTDLERIDLQLLQMVEHAKSETLGDSTYAFDDTVMLNGFSAAGNFVDRFAVLHPDRVQSVTAGGLNGMALLPLEEAEGRTLEYHVGIADVESIVGEPVDLGALDGVDQFLYMGSEDTNDTIGYDDAWTSDELEETALAVYGEHILAERFPFCQQAYERAGVEAQFRVYEGAGHTPRPAEDDLVEFHRRSIEGADVSEFGQDVQATVGFEYEPAAVEAGEAITFDASDSKAVPGAEILGFTWDFGDGETAAGPRPGHSFTASGEYTVTLTAITSTGLRRTTTEQVSVSESENGSDGSTDDSCAISGGDGEVDIEDIRRAVRLYANGGQC